MENVSGNFGIAEYSSHSLQSLGLCNFTSVHGNFMPQHLQAALFLHILASFFITKKRCGCSASILVSLNFLNLFLRVHCKNLYTYSGFFFFPHPVCFFFSFFFLYYFPAPTPFKIIFLSQRSSYLWYSVSEKYRKTFAGKVTEVNLHILVFL